MAGMPIDKLCMISVKFRANHMCEGLYNTWMECNFPNYVTGRSAEAQCFWEEKDEVLAAGLAACTMLTGPGDGPGVLVGNKWTKLTCGYYEDCKKCGSKHVKLAIMSKASRSVYKCLNVLFPYSSPADKSHTMLDLASSVRQIMFEMDDGAKRRARAALAVCRTGWPNSLATALVWAAVGVEGFMKVINLYKVDGVCRLDAEPLEKYLKAVSVAVRRTGRWIDGSELSAAEVAKLAYVELSTGRAKHVTDWADEIKLRCTQATPLIDPFMADEDAGMASYSVMTERSLKGIMDEITGGLKVAESFEEFVQRRQDWAASGSSGGMKIHHEGKSFRLNKRSYLETLSTADCVKYLDDEPIIMAKASEKFELGKSRSIYGTAVKDYVVMSYVLFYVETKLPKLSDVEVGTSGFAEIVNMVKRLYAVSQPGVEATMIDFSDFNLQHTLEAQSMVFRVLAQTLGRRQVHPDLIRACHWCADALLNQWCTFPGEKAPRKIVQGLFSGVRGTNFINTILNVAYFDVGAVMVSREFRLSPVGLYTKKQGDDVWITNMCRLWAILFYCVQQACRLKFGPSKQMFDIGRGEFLRVLYDKDGLFGFVMRALAGFIIKPLQGEEKVDPVARAEGLDAQVRTLQRRGLSEAAAGALWRATVPHWSKVNLGPGLATSIPLNVLMAPVCDGGYGLLPPGSVYHRVSVSGRLPPVPRMQPDVSAIKHVVPHKMATDWATSVARRTGLTDLAYQSAISALHESNVADSASDKEKARALRRLVKNIMRWRRTIPPGVGVVLVARDQTLPLWLSLASSSGSVVQYLPSMVNKVRILVGSRPDDGKIDRPPPMVQTLHRALAASPFKSLATARRVFQGSAIDAFLSALAWVPSASLAAAARSTFQNLRRCCGDELTMYVLEHGDKASPSVTSVLHPTLVGWAHKEAANYAVTSCVVQRLSKPEQFEAELRRYGVMVTDMLLEQRVLRAISNY